MEILGMSLQKGHFLDRIRKSNAELNNNKVLKCIFVSFPQTNHDALLRVQDRECKLRHNLTSAKPFRN